jgi:hypothetical protein
MWGRRIRISIAGVAVVAVSFAALVVIATPVGAIVVNDETSLRAAFADVSNTTIVLGADISLTDCATGAVGRNSGIALQLNGSGHSITQTCAEKQVLVQAGSGAVALTNVTISGGSIGIQSVGPVTIDGSTITGQTSTTGAFGAQVVDNALTVTGSTITNQKNSGSGGTELGAAGLEARDVTVTNSTVSGQSGSGGIGVAGIAAGGSATVTNSTVSGQSSSLVVFGIFGDSGVTVTNSTVSGQSESGGFSANGISTNGSARVTGSTVTDVTGGTNGSAFGVTANSGVAVLSSTTVTAIRGSSATGVSGSDVSLTDTFVSGVSGTVEASGVSGISATVTLNRSTVTGVTADQNAVGVRADRPVTITNSTITGNGGIAASGTSDVVIAYSDIIANGGVPGQIVSPRLTIFGSVLSNARGSTNCSVNAVSSAGYNFADDTSCHLTATGDTQANGVNPQLGPLTNNGGQTPTLLPASTSPLLEKIPLAACQTAPATGITTDQRLLPRPRGVGCDIGSVEIQLPPPAPLVLQPNFTG